jgi:hypothetical protein
MPTDDPAPRTWPRRDTAEAEPGGAPADTTASDRAAASNGTTAPDRPVPDASAPAPAAPAAASTPTSNGDEPRRPRPEPRADLDDFFGPDPRIDEFLAPSTETDHKPARRSRRKSGALAAVAPPAAALVGPVVAEPITTTGPALGGPPGYRARRAARRQRARRVHRLVRHIEPWSVLKLALVFYFCLWVIMLVAGAILWRVAVSSGVIDNIEGFINDILVLDNFKFDGDEMFRAYAVGGLLMVLVATGFTVLATVLFNLISDLIGGVRVTVIQEETARPNPPPPGSG